MDRVILCIDNSGSTAGCEKYWNKVLEIYQEVKPYRLIYWNSVATVNTRFIKHSGGGTKPITFLKILEEETQPYNLIVTTDGEINDNDIDMCSSLVTNKLLSFINSTVIYYIGNENSMNIGLNVILGRTKKVSYHINDHYFDKLYETFEDLDINEFMSPNFTISLIVKIKNIEVAYPGKTTRNTKLSELRGEICRLYSKLEHAALDPKKDKLEEYFQNNQKVEVIRMLAEDRLDVDAVSRQKSVILNLFDRKIDFNISRITASTSIAKQDIEIPDDEDSAWNEFEDVITLDNFSLPCLLVQNINEPVITDLRTLKHPFMLLSQPKTIKKIMRLIEPNPIDYSTYQQLSFDEQGYTQSPHTRAACKGVFIFDVANKKCVKNNCRSISVLFGDQNKVPGNLVLWNLIIMYLLYKHKFKDTPYETVIGDEIIAYCKQQKLNLTFTHKCQVLRNARIEICLWYCIHVTTIYPNNARNVMRSPFGLELLKFYLDTFGRDKDEHLTQLIDRTRKWAVWNYLLKYKNTPDLYLEVKAQYQNYCIHNDQIILLAGKCETPFKSKCNIIDADAVDTLFVNLDNNSSKIDDIDAFKLQTASVVYDDLDGLAEDLTHVHINTKTCWPLVICPVTKKHWKECIQEFEDYDIKQQSYLRLFNTYCFKYRKYPSHYMDLALLFSRRNKGVILNKYNINGFEKVYSIFNDVMIKYTCEEYLSIYTGHTDEKLRLSKE